MPELPEVQTVVSTLRPRLVGRRLCNVTLFRSDILAPTGVNLASELNGQSVCDVQRRGKKILICIEGGRVLCIHLGMTGRLTVENAAAPLPPHTHFVARIADGNGDAMQLRFRDPRRFGGMWWLSCREQAEDGLGPEPLATSSPELRQRLSRTRRAIKTALLDQRILAGLGNIYVDEALFAAGVHPLIPANELSPQQVGRLGRAIKTVLRRAIRSRGSSFRDYVDADGNAGSFQRLHRVYAREGRPCCRCKTPIERIVLGGRSTHFCPTCQPAAGTVVAKRA